MQGVRSYLKTCKATYFIYNNDYSTTEIMHVFDPEGNKNVFFNKLINRLKLTHHVKLDTSCTDEYVYFAELESVPNIIRRGPINSFIDYSKTGTHKLVDTPFDKNIALPPYYLDLVSNNESEEKKFWSDPKFKQFYKENNRFILVPNIGQSTRSFHIDFVEIWNKIKDHNNTYIIEQFLNTLSFILLIKNFDEYKTVTDFQKGDINENIQLLCDIKTFVKEFYQSFLSEIDNNKIKISFVTDLEHGYFILMIKYVNLYNQSEYKSVIDIYRQQSIDDIISILKGRIDGHSDTIKQYYFRQAGGKIGYQINNITLNTSDLQTLLFDSEKPNIEVVSEYYKGNRVHGYCSMFFLIKNNDIYYEISIKSITAQVIHSWTHESLADTKKEFENKYFDQLSKSVLGNPRFKSGKTDVFFGKLPGYCEIYCKRVDNPKIDIVMPILDETRTIYDKRINRAKKLDNIFIDLSIVIHLTWKSQFRNLFQKQSYYLNYRDFQKDLLFGFPKMFSKLGDEYVKLYNLTQKILANPILTSYIIDPFVMSDNYTINVRMVDSTLKIFFTIIYIIKRGLLNKISYQDINTILKKIKCDQITDFDVDKLFIKKDTYTKFNISRLLQQIYDQLGGISYIHILWYTPYDLKITDYELFDNLISQINHEYDAMIEEMVTNNFSIISGYDTITKLNDNYSRLFGNSDYCKEKYNQYVFESTTFKQEFQKDTFVHTIRNVSDSEKNEINSLIDKNDYNNRFHLIGFHYPPLGYYNIFHMHFYSKDYGRAPESIGNYKDEHIGYTNYWEPYGKNIDYSNRDVFHCYGMIQYDLQNKNEIIDSITKKMELMHYDSDTIKIIERNVIHIVDKHI